VPRITGSFLDSKPTLRLAVAVSNSDVQLRLSLMIINKLLVVAHVNPRSSHSLYGIRKQSAPGHSQLQQQVDHDKACAAHHDKLHEATLNVILRLATR
jgi:hypothetical protein